MLAQDVSPGSSGKAAGVPEGRHKFTHTRPCREGKSGNIESAFSRRHEFRNGLILSISECKMNAKSRPLRCPIAERIHGVSDQSLQYLFRGV